MYTNFRHGTGVKCSLSGQKAFSLRGKPFSLTTTGMEFVTRVLSTICVNFRSWVKLSRINQSSQDNFTTTDNLFKKEESSPSKHPPFSISFAKIVAMYVFFLSSKAEKLGSCWWKTSDKFHIWILIGLARCIPCVTDQRQEFSKQVCNS